MAKRLTTEQFVEKAKKVHGDKYDYSLVEYKNSHTKVKIICPEHGIFEQIPNSHYKHECFECGENKRKIKKEDFIKRSNKIHEYKYDYSLVEYKDLYTRVKITCSEHGVFEQTPISNLKGNGCSKCSNKYKYSTDEFIKKVKEIHGNKYDYSLVEYNDALSKIKIICLEHGVFEQRASSHYENGCPKCASKKRGKRNRLNQKHLIDDFKKVHGNKYDYSKVKYINRRTKIIIICKKHGEFKQRPLDHRNGYGCSLCNESKGELKIKNYLEYKNIIFEYQKKFSDCKNISQLPFDFYISKLNLCIEYDGEQHYRAVDFFGGEKEFIKRKLKDKIKDVYCKDNNINILRIKYTNFSKIELILSRYLKLLLL